MAVTLKDVASRAGVSTSAVSRTFTAGASVSRKTREKVLAAAEALGYQPNELARSLTTGRTHLIGLISSNFRNPLFLEVFDRFTRGLQTRDLRPLLVNLSDETDPDASIAMLRRYSVDGVIVASSTLPDSFAHAFRAAGMAVVHSFGRASADPRVDVVGVDNVACGGMAAEALLARGCRDVAFLGGPERATSTEDRLAGFRARLAARPEVRVRHSFADAYSFDAGRREMMRLLERAPAEAYFCGDDVLSLGAVSALREAGLRVPDDVGVIGFNDMAMSGWESVDLTTIRQPIDAIIDASIERVVAQIADPDLPPEARLFDCAVIDRGTLRPI